MPRELREPHLPRTAKVRARALRTGWTTGAGSAAAAEAAAQQLPGAMGRRAYDGQPEVEVSSPNGQVVRLPVKDDAGPTCAFVGMARTRPLAGAGVFLTHATRTGAAR